MLNYSTSGFGSIRVELRDANGAVLPGYAPDACRVICGDEIEHTVQWEGGEDVSSLAGQPLRPRFAMTEAKLYSLRFAGPTIG